VKELKERLLREWRLLDNAHRAAIAPWHGRLNNNNYNNINAMLANHNT